MMKPKILEHVRNVCGLKKDTTVQLNDLLFAIFLMLQYSSSWENHKKILSDLFIPTYDAGVYKNKQLYDLSKTVEQNLEDEALCKLLVEVLNIK